MSRSNERNPKIFNIEGNRKNKRKKKEERIESCKRAVKYEQKIKNSQNKILLGYWKEENSEEETKWKKNIMKEMVFPLRK